MAHTPQLLFVTGLSGAGISSSLKVLEDLGYEVFDNLPLSLVKDLLSKQTDLPVAIGIDTRSRDFNVQDILKAMQELQAQLLFLTCDPEILQTRFKETRRRHPLAKDRPVSDGISYEQQILEPLQTTASTVIDTTQLSIHDLRHALEGYYAQKDTQNLSLTLMSFGFKHGIPREADIVWDVRFLKNPYWDETLRPLTGYDSPVANHIESDEALGPFINNLKSLLEPLFPRYLAEGKHYLTIAIGCTGGQHRSVYVCETLKKWIEELGFAPTVRHRDLN